jgi:hypothetical protein
MPLPMLHFCIRALIGKYPINAEEKHPTTEMSEQREIKCTT